MALSGTQDRAYAHRGVVVLGVLAATVLYGACLAWAISVDARIDRFRTVYTDTRVMAALQAAHAEAGDGTGIPLEVSSGESTTVAGKEFAPAPGNSVQVLVNGVGFCVRTRSIDPEARQWSYDSADLGDEYGDQQGGACG